MNRKVKYPALFLTTALLACQPVSAFAATFSDMSQVPWSGAEASIEKAADLGLMVGETQNGVSVFRPRASVSLCETAQLAYKLMVNTGKLTSSESVTEKWSTVMQTYKLPSWSYTAIAHCLEENIISISDLGGYMKNGGTLPATREQAAEILGRALIASDSSLSAGGTTSFADNSSISSDAQPYVALLSSKGILNGDDDGNFNPKGTLNRTEMAVLVTNMYSKMSSSSGTVTPDTDSNTVTPSTKSGTIGGLTSYYVNFSGSNSYYYFPTNGSATAELNGSTSTLSALVTLFNNGADMTAQINIGSDNRISKISVTAKSASALEGKITSLSESRIKIDSNYYDIDDPDDVTVKIDGDSEDFDELMDLYEDDVTITATLTLDSDDYVTKIVATTKDNDLEGEIISLSESKIKIDSTSYDIDDPDDVTVKIDGSTEDFDELMDLYDDDVEMTAVITLDSKDKYVIKIVVTTDEDDLHGEIKSLSESRIKIGSNSYDIDDPDDVTVKIDGSTEDFDELMDLYDDDVEMTATVTLDSDDYVTKIVATTKDADEEADGIIYSLTTSRLTLKGGHDYDIDDEDDIDIDIEDGTEESSITDWDDLIEAISDDEKEIEVTVLIEDGYVTEIEGEVVGVEGMLTDWTNDTLEIETDEGNIYEYAFDDDVDVDISGIGADDLDEFLDWLEDFDEDEDEVNITLTLENGYITEIDGEYE